MRTHIITPRNHTHVLGAACVWFVQHTQRQRLAVNLQWYRGFKLHPGSSRTHRQAAAEQVAGMPRRRSGWYFIQAAEQQRMRHADGFQQLMCQAQCRVQAGGRRTVTSFARRS